MANGSVYWLKKPTAPHPCIQGMKWRISWTKLASLKQVNLQTSSPDWFATSLRRHQQQSSWLLSHREFYQPKQHWVHQLRMILSRPEEIGLLEASMTWDLGGLATWSWHVITRTNNKCESSGYCCMCNAWSLQRVCVCVCVCVCGGGVFAFC